MYIEWIVKIRLYSKDTSNNSRKIYQIDWSRKDPLCWPHNTLYPQKFTLTSPTSGGRSVGIVRSRTKATWFVICLFLFFKWQQSRSCYCLTSKVRVSCLCNRPWRPIELWDVEAPTLSRPVLFNFEIAYPEGNSKTSYEVRENILRGTQNWKKKLLW
jgi:hypothetical protein